MNPDRDLDERLPLMLQNDPVFVRAGQTDRLQEEAQQIFDGGAPRVVNGFRRPTKLAGTGAPKRARNKQERQNRKRGRNMQKARR